MGILKYKHIEQKKTVADEGETIINLINKEAEDGWVVHTIDFAYGRALLWQVVENESCCSNGECACR